MGFAALSFAVNVVFALASAVVTSRLYGVRVIGQYGLAMTPWLLLVSLSTVSEQVAFVRTLATMQRGSNEATGLFFAVLTLSESLTTLMSVPIVIVSAAVLHGPLDQGASALPAMVIVAGYVIFENPAWNLDSVLSAFSRGRELFWCRLVTVVTFLALSAALYPMTESVWGLAIANVVSFALGLSARLVAVRGLIRPFPTRAAYSDGLRRLPAILRFGVSLLPGQFFIGVTMQAPLWLVANYRGINEVGAYSRASTMAVRLNEASYRVNEMLFPDLVRRHEEGDIEHFRGALERSLRLALTGLLLAASLAGGAAEPVMKVFGDGFSSAAGVLVFLVLAHVCWVSAAIVGAAYNAAGKPYLNSMFSAIRFVVTLCLVTLLVRRHGITAAAAGFFAAHAVELLVRVSYLRRALGLRAGRALGPALLARVVIAYAGGFLVSRLASDLISETIVALPVALIAGAACFVALALLTGLIDTEERRAISLRLVRLAPSLARRE
jgi:O-antigen/teichoic acid export membrane protein